MRSSNTQEAPSDWAWNSLKPTSKAGMFSGVGGGAYAAPQRLVRRAALKQRAEVVHSLQQAEMKRHADEVSSWTVPSWVDEYMGDMSASQDMPISSRDGIIGGLQGPRLIDPSTPEIATPRREAHMRRRQPQGRPPAGRSRWRCPSRPIQRWLRA